MCLAIPGKVLEIKRNYAKVDFGGTIRDVNISLVSVKKGGYVIVHAGFAIQMMDEAEAKETLKLWGELLESEASEQA